MRREKVVSYIGLAIIVVLLGVLAFVGVAATVASAVILWRAVFP